MLLYLLEFRGVQIVFVLLATVIFCSRGNVSVPPWLAEGSRTQQIVVSITSREELENGNHILIGNSCYVGGTILGSGLGI